MMRYLPHTNEDITAMLEKVGVGSLEELFDSIPESCRRTAPLDLPEAMTRMGPQRAHGQLGRRYGGRSAIQGVSGRRQATTTSSLKPSSMLLLRSEIFTAYTPYQPEISQGTLQAIYEYQTLVARLLGMDVANASMYDGASALAEALLMAIRDHPPQKGGCLTCRASAVSPGGGNLSCAHRL